MFLNPFPELLSFSLFAPFLLRVVAGVLLVELGIRTIRVREHLFVILGILELIAGVLFIGGIYTQIVALCVMLITLVILIAHTRDTNLPAVWSDYYLMLFTIATSLLVTGAGAFAFDLPL